MCVTEMTCIATSVADGTQRCKLATVTCPAWWRWSYWFTVHQILDDWMLWLSEYTIFIFFFGGGVALRIRKYFKISLVSSCFRDNSTIIVICALNMNRKLLTLTTCPFGLSMVFCFRSIPFHHPAIITQHYSASFPFVPVLNHRNVLMEALPLFAHGTTI